MLEGQLPVRVGDTVRYARFTRKIIAIREPIGSRQSVCLEVFPEDNVWGGWITVNDKVYDEFSAHVVARALGEKDEVPALEETRGDQS